MFSQWCCELRNQRQKKQKTNRTLLWCSRSARFCVGRSAHNCSLAPRHLQSWGSRRPLRLTPIFTFHSYRTQTHPPLQISDMREKLWVHHSKHTTTSFGGGKRRGRRGTGKGDKGGEGRRLLHLSQVRLGAKGRWSSFPRLRLGAKKAAGRNGENLNDKTSCSWRACDTLWRNENHSNAAICKLLRKHFQMYVGMHFCLNREGTNLIHI